MVMRRKGEAGIRQNSQSSLAQATRFIAGSTLLQVPSAFSCVKLQSVSRLSPFSWRFHLWEEYACICKCLYTHVHACVEVKGQPWVPFFGKYHLVLRHGLSLGLGAHQAGDTG